MPCKKCSGEMVEVYYSLKKSIWQCKKCGHQYKQKRW